MAEVASGRAGPEGPPPAVLARFAAERVVRLATRSADGPRLVPVTFAWHRGTAVWAVDRVKPKRPGPLRGEAAVLEGAEAKAALDALAERYAPYRRDRPPGPVVAVTPRRWAWWSAS